MTTNHSNTTSQWLDHAEISDWPHRFGNAVRVVFEALATGLNASRDYQRLSARLPAQQATEIVLQKHFAKN